MGKLRRRKQTIFHSILLFLLCVGLSLNAFADDQENLFRDLLIVDYWNKKINDRLPVTYNHLLQAGYFAMPSARMGPDGEIGIGLSYVAPYHNYNLRFQIFDRLEITGNYRVFSGVKDPVLSPLGFGDFSDKGANFKFSLFLPEDSAYQLPGLAFGFEDFIGTQAFHSKYVVLTQVFLEQNMEVSLGYGIERIKGFFGGINLMPFRQTKWTYLQQLSLTAEFDSTAYHRSSREPHPKGRVKKSPINWGMKYRLWDCLDCSISYMRGDKLAFSASSYYNFGETKGFLPKINNALPYKAPIITEPLGPRRSEDALVSDLVFAFQEQGFDIWELWISYNECNRKVLRITTLNDTYRLESEVRCHLNHLLAALIPSDIGEVIVVIDSEGFSIQEYHYNMDFVRLYAAQKVGSHELAILTPLTEVTSPDPYSGCRLFGCKRECLNFELSPRTHTLFGSSSGKFKYALGINAAFNGYLWNEVYYNLLIGYTFISNIGNANNFDRLNPSQLINVRSDITRYYAQTGLTLDEAYLQKNWNVGRGWYTRVAGGYFEEEYGGGAAEILYYPLDSAFAVGLEGSILKKRRYSGLGFTNHIRQLDGFRPTYKKFLGSQYFLNVYYDLACANVDFKVSAGKFLANDWGVRSEISRYFPSGLRLTLWYTVTNGHDKINGKTYYDKGVSFSMPFDIFYTCSERTYWNYGMSAWLRDVGVQASTGMQLYRLINDQRQ
ncbi:MAG: YjbH domain-containing protein [Parachlamydiaceae bacterium]